jgi:hypothetical protein
MLDQKMTDRPVCHWVRVRDAQGRIRMEARWAIPSAAVHAA